MEIFPKKQTKQSQFPGRNNKSVVNMCSSVTLLVINRGEFFVKKFKHTFYEMIKEQDFTEWFVKEQGLYQVEKK